MFATALAVSASGALVALLVAVLVYAVGAYLLHAPPQGAGIVALIVFAMLLLGNV